MTVAVAQGAGRRRVRVGWVLLGLTPLFFVLAVLVGDGLLAVQGYDSGQVDLPVGAVLRAGVPAVLVLLAPLVAAAWSGRRAQQLGERRGRTLLVVAASVAALLLVLNLGPLLVRLLGGA